MRRGTFPEDRVGRLEAPWNVRFPLEVAAVTSRRGESCLLRGGELEQPAGVPPISEGRPAEDKGGLRPTKVHETSPGGQISGGCMKDSFPGKTAGQ